MSIQTPQPFFTARRTSLILATLLLASLLVYVAIFNPGKILTPILGGGTPPTISILQPSQPPDLFSGQGIVVVAEANSSQSISQVLFLVDGQLRAEQTIAAGQSTVQAAFPWFATSPGAHELSVLAYDSNGQASAPAAITVQVAAADRAAILEDALVLDDPGNPELDQEQAARAAAAGLPADGGLPPEGAQAGADQAAGGQDGVDADVQADQAVEEEQAGDEAGVIEDLVAPAAELIVEVNRWQGALVAEITARGNDDMGLDFLRLSIAGPAGENQVVIAPCAGQLHCEFELNHALWSSGEWVFHLQAFDLVPQASDAAVTTRQIICQADNNLMECSIVQRDDALGGILEDIIRRQGQLWEQLLAGVQFDPGDIMAGFVFGEGQAPERDPDESFELRGCLIVQPVNRNNPPNGPVTECPEYNLSGEDLSGLDLRGADFERADLRQANLRGALLLWARLFATDLRGADLTNAQIGRAEGRLALLSGSTLNGASLNDAFLSGAQMQNIVGAHLELSRAALVEADLSGANLPSATFNGANLSHANLAGATLDRASFIGANLSGANLVGADLTGADLTNANLFRANFRPENGQLPAGLLNGVIWNNTICPDGSNSDDNGGQCAAANLAPYMISGCTIVIDNRYPDGPQSDCSGLDMAAADFEGRDLRGADFTGTNLQAADMRNGDFRFANFTDANLLGARAFGATYGGATWNNTICPDGSNSDDHNNTCEGFLFP